MSSEPGISMARFGRTLALIGFVTTVFLMLAVSRLEGTVLRVGIVGISVVAFVTAIVGFLVAAATTFDDSI